MAQTENTKAVSAPCLRFDCVTGKAAAATMSAAGCVAEDQVIWCISRNTTTAVPTDRLTTITLQAGCFVSTDDLTDLPVEMLWHDVSG